MDLQLSLLLLNSSTFSVDREEHELHPAKSLYSPFIYSKHANSSSYVSSKCLKYIDVGPYVSVCFFDK